MNRQSVKCKELTPTFFGFTTPFVQVIDFDTNDVVNVKVAFYRYTVGAGEVGHRRCYHGL